MVKTTGACFSLDASGSLASAITYQKTQTRRICRKIPIPKYQRTPAQDSVRKAVAKAVEEWQKLLVIQKAVWYAYINPHGNMGYHAFIQPFIPRTLNFLYQYQLPKDIGYCLVNEWLVGELITGGVWFDP